MPIIVMLASTVVGLLVSMVCFEAGYQALKPKSGGRLQKHQWCWIWWAALGVLSFATGGAAGLVQMAMIFCIAAGHIGLCGVKEDVISPKEIIKSIPAGLRGVYERFRRISS